MKIIIKKNAVLFIKLSTYLFKQYKKIILADIYCSIVIVYLYY